ncbi:energy-coupling factor transporter transmembrane protein EcfT [Neobacillus notoginsengisoli]|uniref:Energy-coupling factor transporter transmembrane protein EcfT n=2 Tax=Neobacillus notoginsengisoli TaxID=1578198 RepID=A0A417YYQ4_9BACI|nr:energy-coupling factor transporter transmembrane protein EcfT [Neobacillus notoginsengisoli]
MQMNRLHPFTAFFYYAGALAMLILFQHPVFLLAGFTFVLLVNFVQDRCRGLQRWFFFLATSGLLIFLVNPLFNERGRHVLLEVWDHRITLEAVTLGGMSALSIMGIIALFVSYNEIMTPNKLLFLFAKVMPQFAVLLMLTLRFIPLMRIRLGEIAAVQASKGILAGSGKLRERAKNGMLYIQALLVFSLEEAIQTADSMKARGYGSGKRSSYHHFRFRRIDWLSLGLLVPSILFAIYGRSMGFGVLTVYPVMEEIGLPKQELLGILLSFVFFLAYPVIIELKGAFGWRKSN